MEWLNLLWILPTIPLSLIFIVLISNRGFRDSFRKHKRLPESLPVALAYDRDRDNPVEKSEMLELLEQQTEWTKALTSHRQYRDTVRINEHAIWNNNYETAHTHFEIFERYNDVTKIPQQVRFDK